MKIVGIGADIEGLERFRGLTIKKDSQFLNKIYTKDELRYCFSHKDPTPHLAVRFSGKEAVIKAISEAYGKTASLKDVHITKSKNGVPIVRMSRTIKNKLNIRVSLSHDEHSAIAFAIIQEIESH